MTPQKQLSKIEQSSQLKKIVELYQEHKNSLSKKQIFNTYIQPLDASLQYHQFVRLTVKLDSKVVVEADKVITQYVDHEVNSAKIRQELYLKALQLGDQSLTSTLELWEKEPEKISSRQLKDFFKMYGEMEKVRQADQMIDLKRQEQLYEQKFKPAGMFANLWVEMFQYSVSGQMTDEDIQMFDDAITPIFERLEVRQKAKLEAQVKS